MNIQFANIIEYRFNHIIGGGASREL